MGLMERRGRMEQWRRRRRWWRRCLQGRRLGASPPCPNFHCCFCCFWPSPWFPFSFLFLDPSPLCVVLMTLPRKLFNTFLTLNFASLQGQTSKMPSTYVVSLILYLNKTLYQSYPPSRLSFRKFQLSIDSIQIELFF